ncbi:MAG: helix-turn-helix domain-containing protein [Bacteroidales bacterium]|nr:helix-turn-helix domain-containing protein [Bacteroidales bacterium]
MSELTIWLVIAILTIVQGFFLSVAILVKSKGKNTANILLSLFVFLISLSLIGRLSYYFSSVGDTFLPGGLVDIIIFCYGPLSFFYLKNLFDGKYFPTWKDYPHFIPLAIYSVYFFYRLLWPQQFENSIFYSNMGSVYFFLELLAIVQNAIYIFIGYKLVNDYEKRIVKELSFLPQVKYVKTFLAVVSVIILFWFYGFVSKYVEGLQFSTVFTYNFVWLLISFLTFLFAYFSYFDSDILSIPEKQTKYEQGYFSADFYDSLKDELENVMNSEKPFLNPKLTLSELARQMGKNQRDLSRVINEHYQKNFYEFVNTYRIQKFKELVQLEENKNYTILFLAHESGFNSKATFNSAFKKITELTPREYINKITS